MQAAINMAQELNKELLGSEEYRRYRETNQRLKEDAELYGRYNEFRRRNCEMQTSEGDSNLYDEVFNLVKEYDTILQDTRVSDFVMAEQHLCNLMQEVYNAMAQGLELDYEYLEK